MVKVTRQSQWIDTIVPPDSLRRVQAVGAGQGAGARGSEGVPRVQDGHHSTRSENILITMIKL